MPSDFPVDPACGSRSRSPADTIGPVLFYRACTDRHLHVDALLAVREQTARLPTLDLVGPPGSGTVSGPVELFRGHGYRVVTFSLELARGAPATYQVNDQRWQVSTELGGAVRIGYVSCNGRERGDGERDPAERNAMWARLEREADSPGGLHLLLHGGDQLYADEVLRAHPGIDKWQMSVSRVAAGLPFDDEMAQAIQRYLLHRYLHLYAQPQIAAVLARVPSLMMWDDHDIIDGWGSLRPRRLDSPIGLGVFANARRMFCVFQLGAREDALPAACLDPQGRSLGWKVSIPGASLLAPDLRSERRPSRVMGAPGWQALTDGLAGAASGEPIFVLSSVPAMGPRLSWVESAMKLLPWMQRYEDDLNDQWQSRAHRAEWQRFLRAMVAVTDSGRPVTLLSGEIHVATRGQLHTPGGARIHQLVASGVAHPEPPRGFAGALGLLARVGEQPLSDCTMRLHPLPGRRAVYTPQRNFLLLTRAHSGRSAEWSAQWSAQWELERDGRTPALPLN